MTAVAPWQAAPPADARFEYRVWGDDLSAISTRIPRSGEPSWVKVSREIYLRGRATPLEINAKMRGGVLDIKRLFDHAGRFERWYPVLKVEFPARSDEVMEALDLLRVDGSMVACGTLSSVEFLVQAGLASGAITVTGVEKHRSGHEVGACAVEVARVIIAHHRVLDSVAVESEDLDAAAEVVDLLGLDVHPNVSYPRLLRTPEGPVVA
jgi:hypothetical protein